jgi:hypothetical protein
VRTTLTLDDDVATRLEREQRKRKATFKQIVNDAIRAGLEALEKRPARKPFRISTADLGPSLIGSLDDIEEALSRAEGEDHK